MLQRVAAFASLFAMMVTNAAPAILDGHVSPVAGDFSQVPEGQETRLRGAQTIQLGVLPGEALAFTLHCHRVGRYENTAKWRLLNAAGTLVRDGDVPVGESATVTVPGAQAGVYALAVDAQLSAYSVRTPLRHLSYTAGGSSALRIIYQVPKLYLWVPTGAQQVRIKVQGQGKAEQAAYVVRGQDGTELATGTSLDNNGETSIPVPAGNGGSVWSLEVSKLADYTFEDVSITIEGDLVPVVAEDPARLLVPVLSAFAKPEGEDARFGLRLDAPPELLTGRRLHYMVRKVGEPVPVEDRVVDAPQPGVISTKLPGPGFVHAEIVGELLDAEGKAVVQSSARLAMAYGKLYTERENVEDHPAAQPSWADMQTGYQVFQRAEPGDIRPSSTPREEELRTELSTRVTPGEFETVYFALHPLRDLGDTQVRIGPFVGPDGRPAEIACDLRAVRCWPQLTDWRSPTFHVVPELLERRASVALRKGVPQQYAAILRVPEGLAPGTYSAEVDVAVGSSRSQAAKLTVEVLPFRLEDPQGIVWGLYPDSGRWARFDEQQILAELQDFRAHGMTALMLYPMSVGQWTWADGKLSVDFTRFRMYLRLYREAGLGGPMVMSIQSSEGFIQRLTGLDREANEAGFWDAYRQMLRLIKRESVDQQWPEFCLHSVDEPHSGPVLEEAKRTLSVIKEEGFKTFNTCYGKAVRDALDPYLDYRCYNNIGFLSMRTPEATQELRRETLAAGDAFWWYGTGCYTNGGLIEDGNVLVNRFMAGVHFWRTEATGCWSWTFLRPKESAYDDFDGGAHREGKDACIAYPTPDGKALVPTLQWEGLREGVDDYRYLATLRTLIERAKREGRGVETARQAETELKAVVEKMPWNCRPGGATTADLDRCRDRIIDQILAVRKAISE